MVQDVPISRPLTASEIDRLVATKDVDRMCPYYVDLQPCVPMLHSMVDRMKGVADAIGLATCLVRHLLLSFEGVGEGFC
eukprot:307378-Chlamydomonas_euryale.AAC.1